MAAVTLKHLAAKLGLSVPTVSLALRNAGNVSAATCARVQAAARELSYKPNVYAAALSTGRATPGAHQMPVAILQWKLRQQIYPIPPFARAVEQAAGALGYRCERCTLDSPAELSRQLRTLYHRGFQGVFIGPFSHDFDEREIDWSRFCVVQCGRYLKQTPFHSVRSEVFESTRFLVAEAIRRGYRRIGAVLFRHDPPLIDDHARVGGMRSEHVGAGNRVLVLAVPPDDLREVLPWIEREQPDAVVGFSVSQYHQLVGADVRVPEAVGFATLHYVPDASNRHISGMRERDSELGDAAAKMMDSLVRHHERGIPATPRTLVIRSEWVEGTTLPFREPAVALPSAGKSAGRKRRVPAAA